MKKLFITLSIVFLSFFGLCSAGSKKKSVETSTQPQLAARPIVFVNFDALCFGDRLRNRFDNKYPRSIEFNEIQKHIDEADKQLKETGNNTEKTNELYKTVNELYNAQSKIRNKFRIVTKNIAKSLGNCVVLGLTRDDQVINPEYDITKKVIDQLNKEYLESSKTCPMCNQSINNN